MGKIKQKNSCFGLLFLALLVMLWSFWQPMAVGERIRASALMFAEKVFPSLFAFSVCSKILVKSGVWEMLAKTPLRALFSAFGVSPSGFSALLLGLLSGFPMGAYILSDLVSRGDMQREEAESLLPFCNNASAAFVVGTVGGLAFDSVKIGRGLFLAQTVSVLFAVILTKQKRRRVTAARSIPYQSKPSPLAVFTSAVAESALAMLSVCAYLVFFSVLSDMLMQILCGVLSCPALLVAFFSGVLELSGGVILLSQTEVPMLVAITVCGSLLGLGGIAVFLQAADPAEKSGIALSFYWKGKLLTMLFSAIWSPLFCFLMEKRFGILGIFLGFAVVFCLYLIKNKIIFQKSVEKQKGMLYNRNEIQCP